ncbi:hypothetical protein DRH27_01590 [Candidatus Falkowbacteria bacterium]|nr:MAG: hypothetical protein DRH27_01590 [Candidatus Falkowbacteria bacterium]
MTAITDIYDQLVTLIEAALTDYVRLPDPYNVDENTELFLRKGYGVAFGDDTNTNRKIGCNKVSIDQQFVVPIMNQVTTTDTNAVGHAALEKALIEDKFKIVKAIETDSDLSGKTMKALYLGSSAITYLEGDRNKYLLTELFISTEYLEVTT